MRRTWFVDFSFQNSNWKPFEVFWTDSWATWPISWIQGLRKDINKLGNVPSLTACMYKMDVHRYDITFREGINRWKTSHRVPHGCTISGHPCPSLAIAGVVGDSWISWLLSRGGCMIHPLSTWILEHLTAPNIQTPHLQRKVFLHRNHVPGLGPMWNRVKNNMGQTKVRKSPL